MTREIYWVGFGFQIWCQLLTHLARATENSLVVVDEPEVYLHPDVQRQLLGIIRDVGADVLLATDSSEIIAEADPAEIVMIDKRRRSGERLESVAGISARLRCSWIVSEHNAHGARQEPPGPVRRGTTRLSIAPAACAKRGLQELSAGISITPLEFGGFGSWQRITVLATGIAEALGVLMIGAVYDRDYFCDEQIEEIVQNSELASNWPGYRSEGDRELLPSSRCPGSRHRSDAKCAERPRRREALPGSGLCGPPSQNHPDYER